MRLAKSITNVVQRLGAEPSDPVVLMQRGLAERDRMSLGGLSSALTSIVSESLWSSRGQFESFGHFAVAAVPAGLGVRTMEAAHVLKGLLIRLGYHAEWGLLLIQIRRPPGHPKTLVNDEGFQPFYGVSTASRSVDRMLCVLHRDHPNVFALLQAREITYQEAVRRAVSPRCKKTELRRSIDKLSGEDQRQLMYDLFCRMPAEGQRDFIITRLDLLRDIDIAAAMRHRQGESGQHRLQLTDRVST
jgi:hypothetical protein